MIRPLAKSLARWLFAGLTLAAGQARAETPPAPARWVTDSAAFLSEGARQEFDLRLETYERQRGHQVLVWISRTAGVVPLEDFTVRSFAAWKVGRKGLDDGLVLFVFADDRKLRVEVGYGLEGQVPDAIASRIIQETIVPRIQTGDRDGAIRSGIAELIAAIEGRGAAPERVALPPPTRSPREESARPLSLGQMVVLGFAVIAFLILFATNPALAVYLLMRALSGGRGGGRGGGSYSGGDGRSGGGGASGSW